MKHIFKNKNLSLAKKKLFSPINIPIRKWHGIRSDINNLSINDVSNNNTTDIDNMQILYQQISDLNKKHEQIEDQIRSLKKNVKDLNYFKERVLYSYPVYGVSY